MFGKWEDRVKDSDEPYLPNNLPRNNDVVDTYPIKNDVTMNALQQLEVDTDQKIKAQEIERQNSTNEINNLMHMALNDSKRVIDGDQYNALFKAFRSSMPDEEATKNFIAENYVMKDDFNSWYVNSGYAKKDSSGGIVVVNADTRVASDGNLIATTTGMGYNTPTFWSATQHFGSGLYDAGESAVSGIWNMGKHPIDTAKNLGNALLHPIDTGEAIWKGVSTSFEEDVINGDADKRARFFGRAAGEVVLGALGTKGLDKVAKVIRGGEVATEAANIAKVSSKVNIYDEFNKIKDPQQRYEYLLDKSKTMDVSTEKNTAIFYSGKVETANGTITARQMAERYADQLFSEKGITKLTLERTPGGKWMDDLKLYERSSTGRFRYEELGLTDKQAGELWRTLSSRYADDASGAITAFTKNVPEWAKPKTVFWSTELPQLRSNPNVTHINIR